MERIAGSLNLRGRIATAIDVRKRLNLEPRSNDQNSIFVVVEYKNELYSLIIDSVGDVINLQDQVCENNPGTLDPLWQDISVGIFKLEDNLLVIMDVPKLIEGIHN